MDILYRNKSRIHKKNQYQYFLYSTSFIQTCTPSECNEPTFSPSSARHLQRLAEQL